MAVKVAINGFGRIGRLAFRQMFGAEGYEVVAINDLTSRENARAPSEVRLPPRADMLLGGSTPSTSTKAKAKTIPSSSTARKSSFTRSRTLTSAPGAKLGVDVVLECTGFYTSKAKAQAHINAGAKKVVISAPAGNDLPTIVYNVNHKTLTTEDTDHLRCFLHHQLPGSYGQGS